jgi:fumarylpyruvate hydrolase
MSTPLETPHYSLPIYQSDARFPVHKIICIGRNYADHAREMGHDAEREAPFFFFKPAAAIAEQGVDFVCPNYSSQVEHEIELVVAIGKPAYKIAPQNVNDCIFGFAVGLDMTCRDLQKQAKEQGRPWEIAKAFDGSAPCSAIVPGDLTTLDTYGELILKKNHVPVQRGHWRQMIWSVPELISNLSQYMHLHVGDLIFTGTPAGVGVVKPGDELQARIDGLPVKLVVDVVAVR